MYNMAQHLVFIILNIFIITGSAFKCPTCSKEDCNKVEIPILECEDNVKELKYGFLTSSSKDSTLACVSLEYEIESEGKIPVRQCLAVSPTENLCKDISLSLPESIKLISCDFEFSEKFELDMLDSFYTSSTTEEPPTTTEEQPTTTEEPSSTTEEPNSTTEEPSSTTEEPSSTTEEPNSTTEEPSSTTEEPSSTTEESTTTTEKSSSTTEESTSTTETSTSTTEVTTSITETTTIGAGSIIISFTVLAISLVLVQLV